MYLDSVEHIKDRVGIFSYKLFRVLARSNLDDDQAPNFVRQRARKNDPALLIPAFQSCNMCRSMNLSPGLTIRTVKPEDDKLHGSVVCVGPGGFWIN